MARLADLVRLKVDGLPAGVNHHSPLADQVTYVFTALNLYAKANNWEQFQHGKHGGRKGNVTMTWLVKELFPEATLEERQLIQQVASRVLRETGAAICLHRPGPADREKGEKPTWYVADEMPDNLVVVATHHKPRSPQPPDRLTYVADRLTPHEAGEDREPEPVETRRVDQNTPEPSRAERNLIVNDEFVTEIFEQIATSQVPITIPELVVLTDRPMWAVRHACEQLLKAGKVFFRIETREEKMVRGGGKLPPARPSKLFWPADPVPSRSSLPAGIEPSKSSADYARERSEQRAKLEALIISYLSENGQRQRTSGVIARNIGQPTNTVRMVLQRLADSHVLRRNSAGSYYVVGTGSERAAAVTKQDWTAAAKQSQTVATSPTPKSDPRPVESSLTDRIKALVDELASGDSFADERAAMMGELDGLRRENEALHRLNKQLQEKLDRAAALFS